MNYKFIGPVYSSDSYYQYFLDSGSINACIAACIMLQKSKVLCLNNILNWRTPTSAKY